MSTGYADKRQRRLTTQRFAVLGVAVQLWFSPLWFSPLMASEEPHPIAVIVSAQAAYAMPVYANELNLIFWRKKLYGHHGQVLRPANLGSEHPLRLRFSEWVLHSTPLSQIAYWNGLYFHGIQPPYTVQSEEAMIRYVADTAQAIGYIDACHLDERVKPVLWLSNGKIVTEPPLLHCDSSD